MRSRGGPLQSRASRNIDRKGDAPRSGGSLVREDVMSEHRTGGEPKKGWYVLLLLQFVLALWVPFYNKVEPVLGGIPFFYWYQLLLILVGAALTAIVYHATERP